METYSQGIVAGQLQPRARSPTAVARMPATCANILATESQVNKLLNLVHKAHGDPQHESQQLKRLPMVSNELRGRDRGALGGRRTGTRDERWGYGYSKLGWR